MQVIEGLHFVGLFIAILLPTHLLLRLLYAAILSNSAQLSGFSNGPKWARFN